MMRHWKNSDDEIAAAAAAAAASRRYKLFWGMISRHVITGCKGRCMILVLVLLYCCGGVWSAYVWYLPAPLSVVDGRTALL